MEAGFEPGSSVPQPELLATWPCCLGENVRSINAQGQPTSVKPLVGAKCYCALDRADLVPTSFKPHRKLGVGVGYHVLQLGTGKPRLREVRDVPMITHLSIQLSHIRPMLGSPPPCTPLVHSSGHAAGPSRSTALDVQCQPSVVTSELLWGSSPQEVPETPMQPSFTASILSLLMGPSLHQDLDTVPCCESAHPAPSATPGVPFFPIL